MALYLLLESASGYAVFSAEGLDEIGQNTEAVRNSITDLNRFGKVVKLVAFSPFQSALDALNQCNSIPKAVARGLKDPSFRVIQNHFAISGNLGEVAAKAESYVMRREDLNKCGSCDYRL